MGAVIINMGIITQPRYFTKYSIPVTRDNFDVVIRGLKLIPGDWDDEIEKLAN